MLFLLIDLERSDIRDLLFLTLGVVGFESGGGSGSSPGMGGMGMWAYAIGGGQLGGRKS